MVWPQRPRRTSGVRRWRAAERMLRGGRSRSCPPTGICYSYAGSPTSAPAFPGAKSAQHPTGTSKTWPSGCALPSVELRVLATGAPFSGPAAEMCGAGKPQEALTQQAERVQGCADQNKTNGSKVAPECRQVVDLHASLAVEVSEHLHRAGFTSRTGRMTAVAGQGEALRPLLSPWGYPPAWIADVKDVHTNLGTRLR